MTEATMTFPYSAQEAFNIMVAHLRKQGVKSKNEDEHLCAYRGQGGMMCAVGALIPDEHYVPECEHNPAQKALEICRINFTEQQVRSKIPAVLRCVQSVHDNWPVDSWETRFADVARRFFLTVPPKEEPCPR